MGMIVLLTLLCLLLLAYHCTWLLTLMRYGPFSHKTVMDRIGMGTAKERILKKKGGGARKRE
jgi:hypothetical protein